MAAVAFAKGFRAAGVAAGIKKKPGVFDMAMISSDTPCAAAVSVTRNRFQAAPVLVSKQMVSKHANEISSVIINSGCANACTADRGLRDAEAMVAQVREAGRGHSLVMSTGVIGPFLPMEKISAGINSAAKQLTPDGWTNASRAIMTTDTVPKLSSQTYELPNGKKFSVTGIAKGAGMIHPNIATMLCVLATDCNVPPAVLREALSHTADRSFNSISVDGDSSTNDSVFVLANGHAGNAPVQVGTPEFNCFRDALQSTATDLAKRLVRDGEGATKFVTVRVENAKTYEEAKQVASSVCRSNLVKTAFYGQDANWGRIICAVGYSGVPVEPHRVSLWFGEGEEGEKELQLVKNGVPHDTNEERASAILRGRDISVRIDLGQGKEKAKMWTCDFSLDYVKINADYRS